MRLLSALVGQFGDQKWGCVLSNDVDVNPITAWSDISSRVRRSYMHHDYLDEKRDAWTKLGFQLESIFSDQLWNSEFDPDLPWCWADACMLSSVVILNGSKFDLAPILLTTHLAIYPHHSS